MPQLDVSTFAPQLVWLVITFAVMFIVMWKVAVPKISDALEQRQMRLEDNLKKAEDLKLEAEATLASYEKALADARAQAHDEIQRIQQSLQEAADKEEADLTAKLDAKLAESEKRIAADVDAAMANVGSVAAELASEVVGKLTGAAPAAGKTATAVDDVLGGKA